MLPIRLLHLNAGNMYGGIESALTNLARLQHLSPSLRFDFGLCFPGRQYEELLSTGPLFMTSEKFDLVALGQSSAPNSAFGIYYVSQNSML